MTSTHTESAERSSESDSIISARIEGDALPRSGIGSATAGAVALSRGSSLSSQLIAVSEDSRPR